VAGQTDSEQARCLVWNAYRLGRCNLAQSVTVSIVDESGLRAMDRYTYQGKSWADDYVRPPSGLTCDKTSIAVTFSELH
jgi:hypothetical protein